MPRLSIIIITKNEGANIGACLDSVAFADERIVVDSNSEDDTSRIATAKGARVVARAFDNFGAQKNFALSLAQGDWVLSLDADERITPALQSEIVRATASSGIDGYEIPRQSSFCGRPIRRGGWSPDRVLRLFRRGKARFSDDIVHERVVCAGKVARLSEPMLHTPVARLEDALVRMDRYSTAGAAMLNGRRVSFASGVSHGLWTFLRMYVFGGGFLDGREGFLLAVVNAEGAYYKYMKAWLAYREDDKRKL
jgi:glycosyltransferase involved in cell wall biosynthesis